MFATPLELDERVIANGRRNRSMLFLGIDQHARQLTVSLRDQNGDVILAGLVSTQPSKMLDFFDQLIQLA